MHIQLWKTLLNLIIEHLTSFHKEQFPEVPEAVPINSRTFKEKRLSTENLKRKGSREGWLDSQKIMRKYFETEVGQNKALRKKQCEIFLDKYKYNFMSIYYY
ncbi:hypothetical protein HHI36_017005 [Cryptolaemus montrouzieri]|uniref:Uncharacterized protein n=1 Tax=Cryptolaemus montrouzieri TaxID=559131 RepID=A0ABD2NLN3_9CUCU